MRPVALAGILASTTMLGGCAATIGGISLSSISSFAGFASTLFTGADLGEHAASLITGKDCRFSEGLLRKDRDVCEEPGSPATRGDFHGIFVDRIDPDGTVIFAAPKYMSASVGAGENENSPDQIWAEIKVQKAKEENERQLARAQAAQTIDVAALATGSLSSQSLAFLPGGVKVAPENAVEYSDSDTASQTATRPRAIANASPVRVSETKAPVSVSTDTDQPAIDAQSFTATARAEPAKATGEGGPFIATATGSAPVSSTLIHGEPVVVLRIGPLFPASPTSAEAAPVAAVETANATGAAMTLTPVAHSTRRSAPSPLAVLEQASPARAQLPTMTASIEPQMAAVRPRTKPAVETAADLTPAEDVAVAKPPKPAKVARAKRVEEEPVDVYQPPARAFEAPSYSTSVDADALHAPVQVPGDIPAEQATMPAPAPTTSEPAPAATGGPAPLVALPQE